MDARGCVLGILVLTATAGASAIAAVPSPHWLRDPDTGCYLYHVDPHAADGGAWSGACVERAANGMGPAGFPQARGLVQSVSRTFAPGAATGAVSLNLAGGPPFRGPGI